MTSASWLVALALVFGLVPAYVGVLYGAGLALVLSIAVASGIVGPAVAVWLDRFMTARPWMQGLHILAMAALGVVLLPG